MRALSLLSGAAGFAAAGVLWWRFAGVIPVPPGGSATATRLSLALAYLLPGVAVLWAMLLVQIAARFVLGASDPSDDRDGRFLRTNQRAIGDTVEHLAVFALAFLALAAGLDGPQMPGALALPVVFAVARAAFWAGYLVAPAGRALGIGATLAATAAALAGAVAAWSGYLPG